MDEWFEHNPFIGFVPWIIYWVVAEGPSTWMFGALCAVLSAIILGVSMGRGGPRLLEIVTIVFFVAVTGAGMVVGAQSTPGCHGRWRTGRRRRSGGPTRR